MGNWNHYRLFLHSQHSFISQREIFCDFPSKDFWFFANWVRHKVYPPAWERGGWESESLRVFNTRQESGNGTRELRTGSRSVPQLWDQNPRLGPGSPTDRVAVYRDLLGGFLGTMRGVGALCFW